MKTRSTHLTWLAVFGAALALTACSHDDLATAPQADTTLSAARSSGPSDELLGARSLGIKDDKSRTQEPESVTNLRTATIDAESGGMLVNGRVSLEFPPGALDTDTEITVIVGRDDLTGKNVQYELLPHGLQFNAPVTLRVQMGGMGLTDADDVRQYWWDETTGSWVDIGGVWDAPVMTTPLEHFSIYRTGRVGW